MKIERDKAKPGTWKLDATIAGRRIREGGFKKKKDAEDFVLELKHRARGRRFGLPSVQAPLSLKALVEAQVATMGTHRNQLRDAGMLKLFLSRFPTGTAAQDVTVMDLRDFVKALRANSEKKTLSSTTVNRYLSPISAMFTAAPKLFEIDEREWRPPRIPWERERKRGKERVISLDERTRLLEALRMSPGRKGSRRGESPATIASRRDCADALEIGLNTAMRPGEVTGLTWSQIDFEACEVHLPDSKTGEPGDIPLNSRAMEILRRRFELRRSRWIFPNQAGDGPRRRPISSIIRPMALSLGLEYGAELENGFTPHSQRHTATTNMFRMGHDMATVMAVTRHSDKTMALRYAHATHQSRRRAVEDLANPHVAKTEQPVKKSTRRKVGKL